MEDIFPHIWEKAWEGTTNNEHNISLSTKDGHYYHGYRCKRCGATCVRYQADGVHPCPPGPNHYINEQTRIDCNEQILREVLDS